MATFYGNYDDFSLDYSMKKFIILTLLVFSHLSFASIKLKTGDILLQPLHCWACNLIEAETESIYSHIGVVIKVENETVFVAEAFMKVRVVSFSEFNKKTQKGLKLKVMRPAYVSNELYKTYLRKFDGLPYDSGFLWDDKKIYCSELLNKLFDEVGMLYPQEIPMVFKHNREYWLKFFKGHIPDGELGIAPKDYDDESLYEFIGEI